MQEDIHCTARTGSRHSTLNNESTSKDAEPNHHNLRHHHYHKYQQSHSTTEYHHSPAEASQVYVSSPVHNQQNDLPSVPDHDHDKSNASLSSPGSRPSSLLRSNEPPLDDKSPCASNVLLSMVVAESATSFEIVDGTIEARETEKATTEESLGEDQIHSPRRLMEGAESTEGVDADVILSPASDGVSEVAISDKNASDEAQNPYASESQYDETSSFVAVHVAINEDPAAALPTEAAKSQSKRRRTSTTPRNPSTRRRGRSSLSATARPVR